jgi:hypothetical protein
MPAGETRTATGMVAPRDHSETLHVEASNRTKPMRIGNDLNS